MQASDVISSPDFTNDRDDLQELIAAPELWPVSLWDAVWIVAGVLGAQLLLLLI